MAPYQVTVRKEDNILYYTAAPQAKKIWVILALVSSVDKLCWNKRAAGANFCDLCTIMCDFPITKSHWRLPGSQKFPLRGLRDTAPFFSYCCFRVDHLKNPPLLVDLQNNKGFF